MKSTANVIPTNRYIQQIAVVNQSTLLKDVNVKGVVHSLQVQITRDFAPAWNILGELNFYSAKAVVPSTFWQMVLLDNADQAGALGYHDLTNTGLPLGKVFIETCNQANIAWSTTLSHELLELLVDPYTDECSLMQNADGSGVLYALEVCDPVENDSYAIGDVAVSNFVFPEWFENLEPNFQKRFDFMGKLNAPFTMTPGGYVSVLNMTNPPSWTQSFADGKRKVAYKRCTGPGKLGHKLSVVKK